MEQDLTQVLNPGMHMSEGNRTLFCRLAHRITGIVRLHQSSWWATLMLVEQEFSLTTPDRRTIDFHPSLHASITWVVWVAGEAAPPEEEEFDKNIHVFFGITSDDPAERRPTYRKPAPPTSPLSAHPFFLFHLPSLPTTTMSTGKRCFMHVLL